MTHKPYSRSLAIALLTCFTTLAAHALDKVVYHIDDAAQQAHGPQAS